MPALAFTPWFAALDALLCSGRPWWQLQPFHFRAYPWQQTHPELCEALDALSDDEVARLDGNGEALADFLSPWLDSTRDLLALSDLPVSSARALQPVKRLDEGIPGRKWQQLQAFAASCPDTHAALPVLEWCAGKGHLGRLLAAAEQRAVTSLEWQASLCEQGASLASKFAVAQRFICGDAFADDARALLQAPVEAVALHACGDLHTTLMQHWAAPAPDADSDLDTDSGAGLDTGRSSDLGLDAGATANEGERNSARRLSISPCCYHLTRHAAYQPLSSSAQASELTLSKADLQLPLQQTVTAGRHVRRQGDQEILWRLSFDEWQRAHQRCDAYLPLPNLKKSLLGGDFATFVRWACEQKSLLIDEQTLEALDEHHWLALGAERLRKVRRMELVTHLFRRPLEVWLALDRVLFLQEQGAQVVLETFCAPALTPRNIVIHAQM